jgi:tRNA(Ile)-lysidine synthase TilS/MesJ
MEKEEFHIKIKMPEFVKILDEPVRKEVLDEVEKKIRPEIEKKFLKTAKDVISQKLELLEGEEEKPPPKKKKEKKEKKAVKEKPAAAEKKNICPNCGKELDPKAKFCRFCGTKIKVTP